MKNKKLIIPLCIVAGLLIAAAALFCIMAAGSLGFSTGRCLVSENDTFMVILDGNSPVCMHNVRGREGLFDNLESGDEILVLHGGIRETYPASTDVHAVFRLSKGDVSDIPAKVIDDLSAFGWKFDLSAGDSAVPDYSFEAAVSYAGCLEPEYFMDYALNPDKMAISSVMHLPIIRFDSLDSMEQFKSGFGDSAMMDQGYNEIPSFGIVTEHIDEAFFEDNTLFLVVVPANSGSYRFGVNEVFNDGENFCIHVEQLNNPEVMTMDMATWFVTVSVPSDAAESCSTFDAYLSRP